MDPNFEPSADNDDDSDTVVRWKIALTIAFFVFLAMAFSISMALGDRSESAGQFGDSFGWLTAIFSSFASAGAVYAVFLQTKEIRQVREESRRNATERSKVTDLRACLILLTDLKERRDRVEKRLAKREQELEDMKNSGDFIKRYQVAIGANKQSVALSDEIEKAKNHRRSLIKRLDVARSELDGYLTKIAEKQGITLDPLDP